MGVLYQSVLIGWADRLWNDLWCVECSIKPWCDSCYCSVHELQI